MAERIHDDETDLSEATIRSLLSAELHELADRPMRYLASSGTTNALFRISVEDGDDIALRMPRTPGASASIALEAAVLPALAATDFAQRIKIPTVLHHGEPTDQFPYHWAALRWLDGDDLWYGPDLDHDRLAIDLGQLVLRLREIDDMPTPDRDLGERGGPIVGVLKSLNRWLTDPRWAAEDLVDVAAIRRLADEAAELGNTESPQGFLHGDLLPGNLITANGRLAAIIDWGCAGYGDVAQDLTPAWAMFEGQARDAFREVVGGDEATWLRARTNELEHTVGAILYYQPRGHALADVMTVTLDRILSDPS